MEITYNINDLNDLFNVTMSIIEDGVEESEDHIDRSVTIYVSSRELHTGIEEALVLLSLSESLLPSETRIEATY